MSAPKPHVVAAAKAKYQLHLDEDFGPHRTDADGRILSFDEKIERWLANESAFEQLFIKIGAKDVYEELSRQEVAKACKHMMDDEEMRDSILREWTSWGLNFIMTHLSYLK